MPVLVANVRESRHGPLRLIAVKIQGKLFNSVFHGNKPTSAGQLFDAPLELFEGFVRPADFTGFKGKAQKVDLLCFGNPALVFVDLEPELAL